MKFSIIYKLSESGRFVGLEFHISFGKECYSRHKWKEFLEMKKLLVNSN